MFFLQLYTSYYASPKKTTATKLSSFCLINKNIFKVLRIIIEFYLAKTKVFKKRTTHPEHIQKRFYVLKLLKCLQCVGCLIFLDLLLCVLLLIHFLKDSCLLLLPLCLCTWVLISWKHDSNSTHASLYMSDYWWWKQVWIIRCSEPQSLKTKIKGEKKVHCIKLNSKWFTNNLQTFLLRLTKKDSHTTY